VVVSLLDRSNPEADDVRCALRRVHPDVPIVIELAPLDGSGRDRARADGLRTAPTPLRASGLVAEVGASTAPA
jgi:hypothetical protein